MKQDKIKVVLHGNEWFYILKTPSVPRAGDRIWCDEIDIDKIILRRPEQKEYVTDEHYVSWGKYYKKCRDQVESSAYFVIQRVTWETTWEMKREGYTKPMWICHGEVDDRWDGDKSLPEPQTHYDDISEIAREIKKLSKKIDIIQSNQLK